MGSDWRARLREAQETHGKDPEEEVNHEAMGACIMGGSCLSDMERDERVTTHG